EPEVASDAYVGHPSAPKEAPDLVAVAEATYLIGSRRGALGWLSHVGIPFVRRAGEGVRGSSEYLLHHLLGDRTGHPPAGHLARVVAWRINHHGDRDFGVVRGCEGHEPGVRRFVGRALRGAGLTADLDAVDASDLTGAVIDDA